MYYHATGEGHIHEIRFCYADTKQEAIEKHLDAFGYKDAAGRQYFGVGVEAYDFNSKKAKYILNEVFKLAPEMHETLMKAGLEMQFKLHYNYA